MTTEGTRDTKATAIDFLRALTLGYRGETESVDKMAARVQFDLDYLRNWSISLDLMIVFKTIWLVFKDARAY